MSVCFRCGRPWQIDRSGSLMCDCTSSSSMTAAPTQPTEAQGDDALGDGVDILGCKADEMFSEVETAVDEVEALTRKLRGAIEKCVVQVVNECADSLARKHRDHAAELAALKASHAEEIAKLRAAKCDICGLPMMLYPHGREFICANCNAPRDMDEELSHGKPESESPDAKASQQVEIEAARSRLAHR